MAPRKTNMIVILAAYYHRLRLSPLADVIEIPRRRHILIRTVPRAKLLIPISEVFAASHGSKTHSRCGY